MDNCYICLEKTSIYFKFLECNCNIYCHEECFKDILKLKKCIICKKKINTSLQKKIDNAIQNILLMKLINVLHDNFLINSILKTKSKYYFIIFAIYSVLISFLTILISGFILIIYLVKYLYYFLNYKNYIKLKIDKLD
jgi:hypothetical protein